MVAHAFAVYTLSWLMPLCPGLVPAVVAIYSGSADGAFTPCQAYAPLVIWEECYKKDLKPKKDPKEIVSKARALWPPAPDPAMEAFAQATPHGQ